MGDPEFSILRICHWIDSINREETGYYPPEPKNTLELNADRHIRGRFGLCMRAMMRIGHERLMTSQNFLPHLAKHGDLPPELVNVFGMYIRTVFFEDGGAIAEPWMRLLVNMEKPGRGWPRLLWQAGLMNPLNGVKPHEESALGFYFKFLYENHRDYRKYKDQQTGLLDAGKSVRVLGPVDYFKSKGWTEEGDGLGSDVLKKLTGADTGRRVMQDNLPDR